MPQSTLGLTLEQQEQLRTIRYWANKMDSQWSVLGVPIGWDALCGLLPVVGDMLTACISLGLVNKARKMHIPKGLLLRMLANVAVDFFGGALPVLGDLFDLSWRANSKNLHLLERHYGLESTGGEVAVSRANIVFVSLLLSLSAALCFAYRQQLYGLLFA